MSYLVDTHIFLWSLISSKKISTKVAKILRDPESSKNISPVSFWEISLKFSLGKLDLVGILPEELPDIARKSNFDAIELDIKTVSSYHKLPKTRHKDPFDRMLVWQAICGDYTLITGDASLAIYENYGLKIIR